MKLFLGKLYKEYPEQFNENFYAAGDEGNSWYGGIKPGDFVFPIFDGKVHKLWRVKEYGQKQNRINLDNSGVVFFETVNSFSKPLSLANEFLRYRYFDLDINLLNKSAKSVKNIGFHKITTLQNCPSPENIIFENNIRKILVAIPQYKDANFIEGDILILLDDFEKTNIKKIEIFRNGNFEQYDSLWKLYTDRNPELERYSIRKLLEYSKVDGASKKESFLKALLGDIQDKGIFSVTNPISLYDNLFVGRKVSKSNKEKITGAQITDGENDDRDTVIELSEYKEFVDLLDDNPNLILYGPPGTGKTFLTRKIVEAFDYEKNKENKTFEDIENEGRAKFITFHQAYSYEEFIEGIRPILNKDNDEEDESNIKYKVENGILKILAESASKQQINKEMEVKTEVQINESSQIWKVSLGRKNSEENIYKYFKKKNQIAIGWLNDQSLEGKNHDEIFKLLIDSRSNNDSKPTNDASSINALVNEMKIGDIVFIYDSPVTIRDIGLITSNYKYVQEDIQYNHRRDVRWLKEFKNPLDIYEMNGKTRLTLKTVYQLNNVNFLDIRGIISKGEEVENSDKAYSPYYLIIDEINRGNVSKIFGELITLIEKDKRETHSCLLPYSQKSFRLPSNIYIIGTMNTADRSLAMLDTALRRRFYFFEVEPDPKVFTRVSTNKLINDNVDLEELLRKINTKLDREHRIGHSYFMDIQSLKQLYLVWYYKILPLLFEYFYNENGKIKKIIGGEFFDENGNIKKLEYKSDKQISPFEQALIYIYTSK